VPGLIVQPRRRQFLRLAAAAAALAVLPRRARALDYPTRPVRIIVPFSPGGTADILARLLGQRLSERLGQPFVVEARPGAAANVGTEAVVRSAPDGYTLLFCFSVNTINTSLYKNLSFDFIRDIAPIASLSRAGNVMEVNPDFPARTVPEFIAYAKANPGKINMAAAGPGSVPHLYGVLFMMMTGVDLVTVHYQGSAPALLDLIGGRVQVTFDPVPSSIGYIKAGKLRPLGVTSASRLDALPDVPPIGDSVPGYVAGGWQGIGAPANTPDAILDKLHGEINAALSDAAFAQRFAELGAPVFITTRADFTRFIAEETEKWGKVIREAGITVE
jgi:tripartite-type tricarboxylate transporter receptor subunit TctC